jgi:hypothetical protein
VKQVDALVVGGGMANTFLLAKGVAVGKSLAEPDLADTARAIMAAASAAGCAIVLPVDAVVAGEFKAGAATVCHDAVPRSDDPRHRPKSVAVSPGSTGRDACGTALSAFSALRQGDDAARRTSRRGKVCPCGGARRCGASPGRRGRQLFISTAGRIIETEPSGRQCCG